MKVILIALVFNFLISCWPKVDIINKLEFKLVCMQFNSNNNWPVFIVRYNEHGVCLWQLCLCTHTDTVTLTAQVLDTNGCIMYK